MQFNQTSLAILVPLCFVSATQAQQLASLDPVMVTATRQEMRVSELLSDISVVEKEELNQAGQSSLGEVLGRQPGIEFIGSGSNGATGSVYMRGTNSGHALVLIDGIRVGSASLGQMSAWSRIPVSQIDRIEILRGPASSLYGSDAIGGVIQIFTRRGQGPMRVEGEIGAGTYDTYSGTVGISGSVSDIHYALNVGGYTTDGFSNIRNPKNSAYNRDKDGYNYQTASGSLSYDIAKGHEIGAQFFYSDGENMYDSGSSATTARRDYRTQEALSTISTYMKNALTSAWTSTIRLGRSTDDSKNITNGLMSSLFRTDQTQYMWQNDLKTGVGNFLLGVERLEQSVTGTSNYRITDRTIDSALAGWNATYLGHSLQTNLRYDDNSQFGGKTTGSASYGYRLNKNWRANIGYGTAFKAPSFNDLYYPLSFGYQGNPNLRPEFAHNREAAVHFETGSHHVSLTYFLNKVENLISWSGVTTPGNVGMARLEGYTLAYEGQIDSLLLSANYNNLDPRDKATGHQLARRSTNYGGASIGQMLGMWEWRVEWQGRDRSYDTDANTRKLGGYSLTNLYGAYHFAKDWSAFARVNNLFDKNYELVGDFGTAGLNAFVGVRYSPK